MTNQVFDQTNNLSAENVSISKKKNPNLINETWTKYHTGALLGLMGGFVILFGVIFLNIFDLFAGEKPHGIWLFLTIFPLFAIGAHCLDKISELKKENIREKSKLNFDI